MFVRGSSEPAIAAEETRGDYTLSEERARLDIDRVCTWLAEQSYWARGRPRDIIERSFAGSMVSGIYLPRGEQVAVARIVTDGATFAWVCDVFVDTAHRGQGLGTWLAKWSVAWSERLGIQRIVLATRDAHSTYARAGFVPVAGPHRWMEIDTRPQRAAALAGKNGNGGE